MSRLLHKIRSLVVRAYTVLATVKFLHVKRKYCHRYYWCDDCNQKDCKLKRFAKYERLGDMNGKETI